ncbi:CoA transferase [Acerihabitans sp. TG2]|uniref:CoA transferase n=1 Tax=Acerihabitans sp. TG2 TaxID=3096008 RepID=UPI002B226006|nr:CoA transferase [Acerihabitans sp. TG2]MEA9393389.1 CoA transferase [Acerihabitans sp. TG2]
MSKFKDDIDKNDSIESSKKLTAESGITRRNVIRSIGVAAIGTVLGGTTASLARAQMAQGHRPVRSGSAPLDGVRVIELSSLLSGRLAGLLLADQGAEVFVNRKDEATLAGLDDAFFDRGKSLVSPAIAKNTSSADIIIVDGDTPVTPEPHQIVLRIMAALPGDEAYGDLPHDCSEDLINAISGFFTNMSISGPILNRPVIYTPIPLPSVYCGVNGAVASVAALVDRLRTGLGREILASRLASGLSAIGALSITSEGLPEHLEPIIVGGLPPGLAPQQFRTFVADALKTPAQQMWLERRFAPFSTPYRTKDNSWYLPMAAPNRRLSRHFLQAMNLWEQALATGAVYVDPYSADSIIFTHRNLGDSLSLGFTYTSKLADLLEAAFVTRTAAEWERYLIAYGAAGSIIMTWQQWQNDADAREAGVFANVPGTENIQIGRAVWTGRAQPYPPLMASGSARYLPAKKLPIPAITGREKASLPLEGYTVADMTNVLAGPCCTRMLVELGASVTRLDVMDPQHAPTIHVMWSGENSAGKRSIILDRRHPDGLNIIHQLTAKVDFIVANMMDDQMTRLGIDAATLAQRNPRAIGLQISATRGEIRGPRHNDKGYDPSIQGTTGIMTRFGGAQTPTFHGIASAVDYLCGYLGAYAGVLALYAREVRADGRGDWAETSLCNAATLIQLLFQRPGSEPPASAQGQLATGATAGARVYQLSDGWIFAQAPRDITTDLDEHDQAQALAWCKQNNIPAVPVQTCKELADRHRKQPTTTVRFEKTENDGWATECFEPTWFAFDRKTQPRAKAASRIGADGPAILAELGYGKTEIEKLVADGAVGRTEWKKG